MVGYLPTIGLPLLSWLSNTKNKCQAWHTEILCWMFSEEELKSYEEVFNQLGITSQEEQKQVLEFMYSIGTIIYNNKE